MHTLDSLQAELDLANRVIREGQAELIEWQKLPSRLPAVMEARYSISMVVIKAKRARANLIEQIANKRADMDALEAYATRICESGLDHYPDY